jgi:hypothetical protein
MYVATIKLRGLYWPVPTQAEAEESAKVGANENRTGMLSTVDPAAAALPPRAARTMPWRLYSATQPEFTLRPGVLVPQPGVSPRVSIPQHVKDALAANIAQASASGANAAEAAENLSLQQVAKAVPGMAQVAVSTMGASNAQGSAIMRDYVARTAGLAL